MSSDVSAIFSIVFINIIDAIFLTVIVLGIVYARSRNGITFKLIAFLMSFVDYAAVLSVAVTAIQIDYPSEYLPTLTILVPISMVIIFLIGLYFYRTIVKPIQDIAEQSKQVASGNLDIKIPVSKRKDEIGILTNNLSKMFDFLNLKPLMEQVKKSVEVLTSSTEQLSSTSEGINAASQEIASTVQDIAIGTVKQKDLIENSLDKAKELQNQFKENSSQLFSASNLIKDFTRDIHYLSINTSVEAANAGEYGIGFAVIAEDIQRLADKTNKSLETINDLVKRAEYTLDSSINTIIGSFENLAMVSGKTAAGTEQVSSSVQEQTAAVEEFSSNFAVLANLARDLSSLTSGIIKEK